MPPWALASINSTTGAGVPPGRAGAAAAAARALSATTTGAGAAAAAGASTSAPGSAAAMAHGKVLATTSSSSSSSAMLATHSSSTGGATASVGGPPDLSLAQLQLLDERQKRVHYHGKRAAVLKQRHQHANRLLEVARAMYAELQRSSWHLTSEFVEGHVVEKNMLRLNGPGDPSGTGSGFSYVLDKARPPKLLVGANGKGGKQKLANNDKTDLRKLTDADRFKILLEMGVPEDSIRGLGRWHQTRMISELARRGRGGAEYQGRYLRETGRTLHEQREDYKHRLVARVCVLAGVCVFACVSIVITK